MGLDTSHNCWHGPYSLFNDLRKFIAEHIGINLNFCVGYDGPQIIELDKINHGSAILLNHSDCDGVLLPDECKKVSDGLTEILGRIDDNIIGKYYHGVVEDIIRFRDGCLDAYNKGETVDFH